MKIIGIIGVLTVAGVLLNQIVTSAPAEETSSLLSGNESTLTCSGDGAAAALESVLEAYDTGGDAAAFAMASTHLDIGLCTFNPNHVKWIDPSYAESFPQFAAYTDVPCRELQNGHCIAIQPVFEDDENGEQIVWSGYMLVEPRVTSGTLPQKTEVSRLEQGLVLDLNY